MNILITGATGLIGSALTAYLVARGHVIYALHRNPETEKPHYWVPEQNLVHLDDSIPLDAVIHLAGENIADGRWTRDRKNRILDSRVHGTKLLAEKLATLEHKPELFISASAIGFYGDTGDNIVDEYSARGTGFLSDIATQWEAATDAAQYAGIRTIKLRTGVVLSRNGGALKKMLLPFTLGFGGVVGNGKQYMSWISINDVLRIIDTMLNSSEMSGPYNLVAPNPVTNRTFTRCLGKALHRPAVLPLPAFLVRMLFGEMGEALLLSGSRVVPSRLLKEGYQFIDGDLEQTLASLLRNH